MRAQHAEGGRVPALLQQLLDEHREILPALDRWAQDLPALAPGEGHARLAALADRLRRHAALEETTLFAAMAGILGHQALAGYEMQHDDIEELLDELLGTPGTLPPGAQALAERLMWICESHFEIEERHIFADAQARLGREQWAQWDHLTSRAAQESA